MSTPDSSDKPPHTEYTALSRKNNRAAQKPLRDIGVGRFIRPGGTMVVAGHVMPGSAFETLGRKKKGVQRKVEVARDMSREGTVDDEKTNDPVVAPDIRGDTPGAAVMEADLEHTPSDKQDKPVDVIKPQEEKHEGSDRALQTLRPNVVRPAPVARQIKAKAGAWGNSKLMKPAKDTVKPTGASPSTDRADSIARATLAAETTTRSERLARGMALPRDRKFAIERTKRLAPVDSLGPLPRKQLPQPQRVNKKRRASLTAPLFSLSEEGGPKDDDDDDDDDDDILAVKNNRRRRVTFALPSQASPPQTPPPRLQDSPDQKAAFTLPDKTVGEQLPQLDDDDPLILDPNTRPRRRCAKPASHHQVHTTTNQPESSPLSETTKAAADALLQLSQEVPSPVPNPTEAAADALLQLSQDVSPSLSDKAAINQLLQLGAPPSDASIHPSIPMAKFSNATPTPRSTPTDRPQPQLHPKPQSQLQLELPRQKGKAYRPQPKRARPKNLDPTTTTSNDPTQNSPTPSPPNKEIKPAPKAKPAKKPTTSPTVTAFVANPPNTPAAATSTMKTGAAAVARKKGVATKIAAPKKKRNMKGYVLVSVSGSESSG